MSSCDDYKNFKNFDFNKKTKKYIKITILLRYSNNVQNS